MPISKLKASSIGSGTIDNARISLDADEIPSLPTSKITSGTFDDARIASSSVNQHATSFDDNKLVNDISTLALREATTANRAASNTNSQYVDVFQDSTGYTNGANTLRASSEYVSTLSSTTTTLDLGTHYTVGDTVGGASHSDGNNTITSNASGSGMFNLKDENSNNGIQGWQAGDVYVATVTCQQVGQGAGPNFFPMGVTINQQMDAYYHGSGSYTDQARCNVSSFGGSTNVDDTLVTTITLGTVGAASVTGADITMTSVRNIGGTVTNDTNSNLYVNGSNFDSATLTANGLYFFHSAWKDSGNDWRVHHTIQRTQSTVNATGNFTCPAITAGSSTSKMGAVITYQDQAGTNALNTDIILQLSADNGSNFTTATLTALPDFATGIKMAKVNDLSVTAGTQLKYKILFANQSASKEARIRGVSLNY